MPGTRGPALRAEFPDDRDLGEVLTRLARVTPAGRRRLANNPNTRAFLDAALDLTHELFAASFSESEENADSRPTLAYLSKPRVVSRARRNASSSAQANGAVPTAAMFKDRWRSQSDFLADFISYALTARHWSLHLALSESARQLLTDPNEDLAQSVHAVAYEDLLLVLDLPAYRFQLLAVASAQADSVAADALSRMYRSLSAAWCALYQEVFDRLGIAFRPGVSVDTFNVILQATAEGLGLRLLSQTDEPLMNPDTRTSVLGTAALALLIAFVDPGDGHTLEELASSIGARNTSS